VGPKENGHSRRNGPFDASAFFTPSAAGTEWQTPPPETAMDGMQLP